MNILHIYRTYFPDPPGGLQEAIRQISLGTAKWGAVSRVFTLAPEPDPRYIERPEARVIRAKSWCAPASCDLGGGASFRLFADEVRWADVLHFHFPWPFADVLNCVTPVRKPRVMTYHSDIVRQKILGFFYGPLMRQTLRSMDAVVATSPAYARTSTVLQRFVSPERLRVIPLGIEDRVSKGRVVVDESGLLQRLSVADRPFFLALGVLRYYKGLHTLVDAARDTQGAIVIAGSGPEDGRLREQVRALRVTNVIFAGQVSEQEKDVLLANCRALVLPSHVRSEAFGMVLVEASMFAKPMVCCEVGSGTSFVNLHDKTGYVVRPEQPAELAAAMNRLFSDEAQALQMGLHARERYESMLSGQALGEAYYRLYCDAIRR